MTEMSDDVLQMQFIQDTGCTPDDPDYEERLDAWLEERSRDSDYNDFTERYPSWAPGADA